MRDFTQDKPRTTILGLTALVHWALNERYIQPAVF